jgi:hypothetical protein
MEFVGLSPRYDDGAWEAQWTGRSSNDGCEEWIATPRDAISGGFRLASAPHQAKPAPAEAAPSQPSTQERLRSRPIQQEVSPMASAPQFESSGPSPPAAPEPTPSDTAGGHGRRKDAAVAAAKDMAQSLGLTPGTTQLVARAAEFGAAAALALPQTPAEVVGTIEDEAEEEEDAENVLGDTSNRKEGEENLNYLEKKRRRRRRKEKKEKKEEKDKERKKERKKAEQVSI